MKRPVEALVWDAVVDKLSLDPDYDRDGAVRVADAARDLMVRGRSFDREQAQERRRGRRRELLKDLLAWGAIAGALVAVVGGITYGAVAQARSRSNDYAHTDPGSVEDGALFYIHEWYGENDMPQGLELLSKQHAEADGHRAWLARFQSRDGKLVCAAVWGRSKTGAPHGTYGKVVSCP